MKPKWQVLRQGKGLHLLGPGMDIEIKDFDPSRVRTLEEDDWRCWNYEVSPDVLLLLFLDRQPPEHYFIELNHAGWRVRWDVPEEFAEALRSCQAHVDIPQKKQRPADMDQPAEG